MKKNLLREIILIVVLLAAFLTLSFVIPFEHTNLFWLSFAFSLLAIALQGVTLALALHKGESYKSKFYGFPVLRLGLLYLLLQLVFGFLGMALGNRFPLWAAAVVFVMLLLLFSVGLVAADAARDLVEQGEQTVQQKTANMFSLRDKALSLSKLPCDSETGPLLSSLSDAFRFSDPVGSEATAAKEAQLFVLLDELQSSLLAEDFAAARKTIAQTHLVLDERNSVCKLSK